MTNPIQSRTPPISPQQSERFDISRASLTSLSSMIDRLGAAAGAGVKKRTEDDPERVEENEGRCASGDDCAIVCDKMDASKGK
jgi:hypothetical protein